LRGKGTVPWLPKQKEKKGGGKKKTPEGGKGPSRKKGSTDPITGELRARGYHFLLQEKGGKRSGAKEYLSTTGIPAGEAFHLRKREKKGRLRGKNFKALIGRV